VRIFGGTIGGQAKFFAQRTFHQVAGNGSKPHLGPAQVLENPHMCSGLTAQLADVSKDRRVLLVGAVREVEPKDIDAGVDQLAQDRGRARRRADRGDDLRAYRRQRVNFLLRHGYSTSQGSPSSSSAWRITPALARSSFVSSALSGCGNVSRTP